MKYSLSLLLVKSCMGYTTSRLLHSLHSSVTMSSISRIYGANELSFGSLLTPGVSQDIMNLNIDHLNLNRYTIWPNFLMNEDLAAVCLDLDERYDRGDMRDAAVKGPSTSTSDVIPSQEYNELSRRSVIASVRKTSTVWLDYMHPSSDTESKLFRYFPHAARSRIRL
jgi:hypothetical protein